MEPARRVRDPDQDAGEVAEEGNVGESHLRGGMVGTDQGQGRCQRGYVRPTPAGCRTCSRTRRTQGYSFVGTEKKPNTLRVGLGDMTLSTKAYVKRTPEKPTAEYVSQPRLPVAQYAASHMAT